jgi:hypothetical protein
LWTPELRKQVGCTEVDDGTFHIPYDDYLEEYLWTSFCVDVDKEYKRSQTFKEF